MRAKTHTLRERLSVRVCVRGPLALPFQPITMAPWCEFLYALAIVGVCVPLCAIYSHI